MEGKHLTSNAIYGYKKKPEDNNHWLVDEEAAAVVRRIFQLIIEGNGPMQVARILTNEKVERPSYYLAKTSICQYTNPEDWMIFRDTQEAIVDEDTWYVVQKIRETKHRPIAQGEANPLTGLMFCASIRGAKYCQPPHERL